MEVSFRRELHPVCPTYPAGAWFYETGRRFGLGGGPDRAAAVSDRSEPHFPERYVQRWYRAWLIGMHHAPLFAGLAPMASGIDDVLFPFWRISGQRRSISSMDLKIRSCRWN